MFVALFLILSFLTACGDSGGASSPNVAAVDQPPLKPEENQKIKIAESGDSVFFAYTNVTVDYDARIFCGTKTEYKTPYYVSRLADFNKLNLSKISVDLKKEFDGTSWWVLKNIYDQKYLSGDYNVIYSVESKITGFSYAAQRDAYDKIVELEMANLSEAVMALVPNGAKYNLRIVENQNKYAMGKAYVICEVKKIKQEDLVRVYPLLNFCEYRKDFSCEKIPPKITIKYNKPSSYVTYASFDISVDERIDYTTFECRIDSLSVYCPYIYYPSSTIYLYSLTGGKHTLEVKVDDLNGNTGFASYEFEMPSRVSMKTSGTISFLKDNATGKKLTEIFAEATYDVQKSGCQNLSLDASSWRLPYESELDSFGGVGAAKFFEEPVGVWTADTSYMSGTVSGQYKSSVLYAGVYDLYTGFFNKYVQTTPIYGTVYPKNRAVCFSGN